MPVIYLALGSNSGNREKFMHNAIGELKANGIRVLKVSKFMETKPVDCPPGSSNFLNAVLKGETNLAPEELHYLTQAVEQRLGRIRTERNAPRTIDIDILLYGDIKLISRNLQIPHPRMFERDFVLKPFQEIGGRVE